MLRKITLTILFTVLCSQAQAAGAEHDQLATAHFTIEGVRDDRTVRFLADHADAIAEGVSSQLGFKLKGRIQVIVAPDKKRFHSAQPEGARLPDWAVGVAYPHRNLIVLLKNPRGDLLQTFEHEVCHILLGRAFGKGHRVPRWLDEGIAILIAKEWNMQRLATMSMAVLSGSLLSMDTITLSFPRDARRAELAYCQSFYFISFLITRFGEKDFRSFLRTYSSCKDFRLALWKTYYLRWDEIEQMWQEYLKVRFGWLPVLFSTGTVWFFASLVFVWGYFYKKQKARKKMRQWELEELLSGETDETLH